MTVACLPADPCGGDGDVPVRAAPRALKEGRLPTLTKTALLEREGWSLSLVNSLLGEPDDRKKVAGYRIPLALFNLCRVEQAEASLEFIKAQPELARRKAAAVKAKATKIERLEETTRAMRITVLKLPLDRVQEEAIDHYNDRETEMWLAGRRSVDDDRSADKDSNPAFLKRIMVNYIRHELTEYDRTLETTIGKVGRYSVIPELMNRVFTQIADTYPELADECRRQLARKASNDILGQGSIIPDNSTEVSGTPTM
jgi:hypothetical protein